MNGYRNYAEVASDRINLITNLTKEMTMKVAGSFVLGDGTINDYEDYINPTGTGDDTMGYYFADNQKLTVVDINLAIFNGQYFFGKVENKEIFLDVNRFLLPPGLKASLIIETTGNGVAAGIFSGYQFL